LRLSTRPTRSAFAERVPSVTELARLPDTSEIGSGATILNATFEWRFLRLEG